MHRSIDVGRQTEHCWLIRFGKLADERNEASHVLGLRCVGHIRKSCLAFQSLVLEDLVHVAAEDTHVELVVDAPTIDSVLQDTVDFLPSDRSATTFFQDVGQDQVTSLQITIGELVVLGPALWDELSPLLDHRVEPREHEQKLHLVGLLAAVRRGNVLERPLQVVFHARWCFVRDLQA